MKHGPAILTIILLCGSSLAAAGQGAEVKSALEEYDKAFRSKDVEAVKSLLAPNILIYEHSVRNDGVQDAFENHLKPEILEFQGLQIDFSDVRMHPTEGRASTEPLQLDRAWSTGEKATV